MARQTPMVRRRGWLWRLLHSGVLPFTVIHRDHPDYPIAVSTVGIPTYVMLDVWMALGGSPAAFDRMWAEDRRTPADTWAQLLAMVRRSYGSLMEDTNPPAGPEFERLMTAGGDGR